MSRLKAYPHIEVDRAGWRNYLHLTCTVSGDTLLQKKWWSQDDWDEESEKFLNDHPVKV